MLGDAVTVDFYGCKYAATIVGFQVASGLPNVRYNIDRTYESGVSLERIRRETRGVRLGVGIRHSTDRNLLLEESGESRKNTDRNRTVTLKRKKCPTPFVQPVMDESINEEVLERSSNIKGGFQGVEYNGESVQPWDASWKTDRITYKIGKFSTAVEAAHARYLFGQKRGGNMRKTDTETPFRKENENKRKAVEDEDDYVAEAALEAASNEIKPLSLGPPVHDANEAIKNKKKRRRKEETKSLKSDVQDESENRAKRKKVNRGGAARDDKENEQDKDMAAKKKDRHFGEHFEDRKAKKEKEKQQETKEEKKKKKAKKAKKEAKKAKKEVEKRAKKEVEKRAKKKEEEKKEKKKEKKGKKTNKAESEMAATKADKMKRKEAKTKPKGSQNVKKKHAQSPIGFDFETLKPENYVGSIVEKDFGDAIGKHSGEVVSYDPEEKHFVVLYRDMYREELAIDSLQSVIKLLPESGDERLPRADDTRSGYHGVHWHKGSQLFESYGLNKGGDRVYLGRFTSAVQAARVRAKNFLSFGFVE